MRVEEREHLSGWYDVYEHVGGVMLSDWSSIDELLDWRDAMRVDEPDTHWLFVLDDPKQAAYTSHHATDTHDIGWFDDDELPVDGRVPVGDFFVASPRLYIARAAAQLIERSETTSLDRAQLLPIDAEEVELISRYNDPVRAFGESVRVLRVEVDRASLALVGLPNGYFFGDLNPFENHVLAEQMFEQFGLELLGLGSYLIAFVRANEIDPTEAAAIVESVRHLYEGFTDENASQLAAAISGRRWVLLHYRGS